MKPQIRSMIGHWDWVWRHYRRTTDLLPKDSIVIKLLLPGSTLAWNSLGMRYRQCVKDLTVHEELLDQMPNISVQFNNVLVLNAFELRYKSVAELGVCLGQLSERLLPDGRLLFGINSIWINWNRTAFPLDHALEQLIRYLADHHEMVLTRSVVRPFETDALNGDCFFIFDKQSRTQVLEDKN